MNSNRGDQAYVVPRYRAGDGEAWFHFLHGNVPGHEIDFMYRPEVPQGALGRSHFSHLARLMRYIEPHDGAAYAFTIGNLSRDDTQHEPGHGGMAFIFGLRIRGATDHAGRPDPPFAHGLAAIDHAFDAPTLLGAAVAFHRRVLGGAASAAWYRSYVRAISEAPAELERVLAGYVDGFDDLPRPAPSASSLAWTTGGVTHPGRVMFVYPDDAPFEVLAGAAARIAAVLYRSDVRWSAISNGREADLPNGTTVRFVPESAVGPGNAAAAWHAITEIPDDDDAIARELFGAMPVRARLMVPGWRDRYAGSDAAAAPLEQDIPITIEDPASAPAGRVEGVVEETAGDGDSEAAGGTTTQAAGEPSPEMVLETTLVEAPVAAWERPAVMIPIPVPLPLVSPPAPAVPSEPPPRFGRSRKKAAAVAGCFVAGVIAVLCAIPRARPVVEPAPPPPVVELAPEVASAEKALTVLAPPTASTSTGRPPPKCQGCRGGAGPRPKCVVLGGPCF